ncbi:uncharacterized protein [Rutidosis leptorrhynchoides]|uniref:uncharacterized protein n=1 Tax=Rutidosis leptorrhynchoides TaxID=125765 RepID=UPI003A99B434
MNRARYSRLCCFINESIHSYKVKSTEAMTKEEEKSLLINLSQVLSNIKLWTNELDSDSDSETGDHVATSIDSLVDNSTCHSSATECIYKITNDLVCLLGVENRYVQHLVVNVLVSISEFVVASGNYWEDFVKTICFYFEICMWKVISPSFDPLLRVKHLDYDSLDWEMSLQLVLKSAGWYSVGAIVLALRTVLKQVKNEDDVEVLDVYLNHLGLFLQRIPWDSCNEIFVDEFEFFGYLVQLFCSIVSCSSLPETVAIREILNIFPKILTWCLVKQGESFSYTRTFQYIRHKILVLMIRLSSLVNLDCTMVVSWLNLIDIYFQDLLYKSLIEPEDDEDDCLKDSPFNETSHKHLQRRVVFLYLKCAFTLIGLKERCVCGDVNACSKKGLTTIYEWVQKQLPGNMLVNVELYDDNCRKFTKSFLQLYMHEDDMLFEVLLQLTYAPFGDTHQIHEDVKYQTVEKDIFFLLFDPVHLFHLFLSELHYDHQVLLDYLISKDTGASCAEYLLRCLRIICDKWNSFIGFPSWVEVRSQKFNKRRKCTHEDLSSESISDKISISYKTDDNNEKTCKRPFHDARDCLLLLKKSVESLHQKDLFPYNPQVLLRRLSRFQELCLRPYG